MKRNRYRYIILCNALVAVTALYIYIYAHRAVVQKCGLFVIINNNNTCARLPIRAAVECAAGKRKAKRLSLPPSDLFFKVYTKVPLSACRRRRRRRRRISLRYHCEF